MSWSSEATVVHTEDYLFCVLVIHARRHPLDNFFAAARFEIVAGEFRDVELPERQNFHEFAGGGLGVEQFAMRLAVVDQLWGCVRHRGAPSIPWQFLRGGTKGSP